MLRIDYKVASNVGRNGIFCDKIKLAKKVISYSL